MGKDQSRQTGSIHDFEEDWQNVINLDDTNFYIFPTLERNTQVDLLEWIKAQQIVNLLHDSGIQSGSTLEYGCGAAGISLYLAALGYRANICDLSTNAIRVAKRNKAYHAIEAEFASTVICDVLELPYRDESFDVVMSFGLLEHFEDEPLQQLLKETIRVLKPGGIFLADIVPGMKHLNARLFGMSINYIGSIFKHFLKGRIKEIPELYGRYFDHYFENTYSDLYWEKILNYYGLREVHVDVCRPFPPLALKGWSDEIYTKLMRQSLKLHQQFDKTNNWFTRRWGWMYLASGQKQRKSP